MGFDHLTVFMAIRSLNEIATVTSIFISRHKNKLFLYNAYGQADLYTCGKSATLFHQHRK